ncbi:MAG: hypothetical protein NXI20_07930 [bacterium]|nr:hypothetical protein [bacterium]
MDLIQELANILEQDLPKSFNLLLPKDSKLRKLYDQKAKRAKDDKFVAKALYKSGPGDKRFMMLRRNLIEKLSELVLVANHSDINNKNYIRIQFDCERQLTVARKLLFVNVYHNAERLTLKALKKAESYHLVDVEMGCYQNLRKIYYLKGYVSEVQKYQQLVSIKQKEQEIVDKARGTVEMALSETKFLRSQSRELGMKFARYADEISKDLNSIDSPFLKLHLLRIQIIRYHQFNDLVNWHKSLLAIQDLLKEYSYLETIHLALEINISWVKYYNSLGDYKASNNALTPLLKYTSYKAFNRFEVLAEMFDREVNYGSIKNAVDICLEVVSPQQYSLLDKQDKAAWTIRFAFCYAMLHQDEENRHRIPGFNISRMQEFYSNCTAISSDKTGYNWQFVVIRTILLSIKGVIDYENEANNLRVYYQRYLKNTTHERTMMFFKFFIRFLKYGMDEQQLKLINDEFQEEFDGLKGSKDYCELVRYELLWETIISIRVSQN